MKIGIVNDYLEYAGGEYFCHLLIEGLKKLGHEAEMITPPTDNSGEGAPDPKTILEKIAEYKPDLIHFNNIGRVGLIPVHYAIHHNIPHILTVHDYWPVCKTRILLSDNFQICETARWIECKNCKSGLSNLPDPPKMAVMLNRITKVVQSNYQKRVLKRFDYDEKKIEVIRLGIKLDQYLPNFEGKHDFVWSGRFHLEKGLPFYMKLAELFPQYNFYVTGGGTEVQVNDFGKTKPLGKIPYPELYKLYQDSIAYVLTSIWPEIAGYTQLEAQALGTPIIGFNVGAVPEYVADEKGGLLVDRGDLVQLADAVKYLAENSTVVEEMGRGARANMEKFSIDKTVEKYVSVYRNELKKG